eukprot:c24397_g1_i1.p1 GENE.c24397_g1_i1~~c24397_g1_i1.p1  ORF type:complete len:290 (-),score=98.85 c24397_g1_i1:61-930(-)
MRTIYSRFNAIRSGFTNPIKTRFSTMCTSTAEQNYDRSQKTQRNGFILFVPGVIACGCGVWQLKRMVWKQGLLEKRQLGLKQEPIPITSIEEFSAISDNEYKRFVFSGKWDSEKEILVGPRSQPSTASAKSNAHSETGFHLISPFYLSNGGVILVNRGWISSKIKDKKLRPQKNSQEMTTVNAVHRIPEKPGSFVPLNEPNKGNWFFIDTNAMTSYFDLNSSSQVPYFEEICIDRSNHEQPIPKSIDDYNHFSVSPNGHAGYAATWFSLAGGSFLMTYSVLKKSKFGRK